MIAPSDLLQFRERMGWSHIMCARFLGVDHSSWFGWCRGARLPNSLNAEKIEAMLALSNTADGRTELHAWANEVTARREARKLGMKLPSR